jgi:FAD/FMN-containing dehydrogenase
VPARAGDRSRFEAKNDIEAAANGVAWVLDGTVSAEHGISQLIATSYRIRKARPDWLLCALKAALDPIEMLNPGTVIPN